MGEQARSDAREPPSRGRPESGNRAPRSTQALAGRSPAAQALALQRAAGNRAATRVLSRWAAHPDKDKKGVLMPDAMAAEFLKFNPPLSK